MLLSTTTLFSQRAEASPLWLRVFPKRRIRRGRTSIFRVRCEKAMRGCASRVPLPPGAAARRTRGVLVEGATPLFWTLVRHRVGVKGDTQNDTFTLPLKGGRSLHIDPCGKAEMLKAWTRVVLLNLVLTAPGLRAWLSPCLAPGEVALPDLVWATDPLGVFTLKAPHRRPTPGPSNAPSRPSGHVGARTGPSGRRLPPALRHGTTPSASRLLRAFSVSKTPVVLVLFRAWRLGCVYIWTKLSSW